MRDDVRASWLAASPYLDTALDLPPAQRAAWLASMRATAPQLADQIAHWLAECDGLDVGFLDEAAALDPRGARALARRRQVAAAPAGALIADHDAVQVTSALALERGVSHVTRRTAEFVKLMEEHQLFELTPLAIPRANPDGTPAEPVRIGEYLRINEQKLNQLAQDKFLELRDRGVTAVMHAHLLSLGLWPKILSRAARIQANTPLS
mgnify:CR=1 FL=1